MIHIKYGCKDNEKIQGTRINQRKKLTPVEIVLNIVDYHRCKYNCSVPFYRFLFQVEFNIFLLHFLEISFLFRIFAAWKCLFDKMQMI